MKTQRNQQPVEKGIQPRADGSRPCNFPTYPYQDRKQRRLDKYQQRGSDNGDDPCHDDSAAFTAEKG